MSAQSEFINLLLADGMARKYGLNRVAAVQRWARRVRNTTKDAKIYDTATTIVRTKHKHRIGEMIQKLNAKLEEEGIL